MGVRHAPGGSPFMLFPRHIGQVAGDGYCPGSRTEVGITDLLM
jgi:hypothetical protein